MTVLPNLNTLTPEQQAQAADLGQTKDETVTTSAEPAEAETSTVPATTPDTPAEEAISSAPTPQPEQSAAPAPEPSPEDPHGMKDGEGASDDDDSDKEEAPAHTEEAATENDAPKTLPQAAEAATLAAQNDSSIAASEATAPFISGAQMAPSSHADATVQGTTTATKTAPTTAAVVPGNPTVSPALVNVDGTATAQPVATPVEREAAVNGTAAPTLESHSLETTKTFASQAGTATSPAPVEGGVAVTTALAGGVPIQTVAGPGGTVAAANPAPAADTAEVAPTTTQTNDEEATVTTSTTILPTDDDNVKSLKTQLQAFAEKASAPGNDPTQFRASAGLISQITNFVIAYPKVPVLDALLAFFKENITGVAQNTEYMKGVTLLDNGSQQKIGYLWTLFSNMATKTVFKINAGQAVTILKKLEIIEYYNRKQTAIKQGTAS